MINLEKDSIDGMIDPVDRCGDGTVVTSKMGTKDFGKRRKCVQAGLRGYDEGQ